MAGRIRRATPDQLPLPLFERCRACGQVIRNVPPDDVLGEAILALLSQANGRLVRYSLIRDFVGMRAARTTIHERLRRFEGKKLKYIERDKKHPKSGYRITEAGRRYLARQHEHAVKKAA